MKFIIQVTLLSMFVFQIIGCQKDVFDDTSTASLNSTAVSKRSDDEPEKFGVPILLKSIEGIDLCEKGVDKYGVSYTVDLVTFNYYYNRNSNGLWVIIYDNNANIVFQEFDDICLDPDEYRHNLRIFKCGATGPVFSLNRSSNYFMVLTDGFGAWSPTYAFTTPNTSPCAP